MVGPVVEVDGEASPERSDGVRAEVVGLHMQWDEGGGRRIEKLLFFLFKVYCSSWEILFGVVVLINFVLK